MIVDRLSNAGFYAGLHPLLKRGLEYLRRTDLEALEPGRHEIEGDDLFALVMDYETKPPDEARWEAHRRHLDIQCLVAGEERLGYADLARLEEGKYDAGKDFLALSGRGDFLSLSRGMFVVFMPHDGHAPGLSLHAPRRVKKVVVKVKVASE